MIHSNRPGPAALFAALCVLVLVLTAPHAFAQFSSGFTGNVSDQTGAALVGAKITATNEATLVSKVAISNTSGNFNIPSLPGGTYAIEVSAAGFKAWKQAGVQLESNETKTLHPTLVLPTQTASVEVSGAVASIETDKSDTSREINQETVSTAPLVGRNVYTSVIELAPGITGSGLPSGGALGSGSANNDSFEQEAGYQINAAGQRQENNEYDVDGSGLNSAINNYGIVGGTSLDLSQGAIQKTGNPLDVAIQGSAFFAVQTPNGVMYTRNGGFQVSSTGQLVTQAGDPVLGDKGPITMLPGAVSISTDGTISFGGAVAGKIRLANFPAGTTLTTEGNSYYSAPADIEQPSTDSKVLQGALENSNVNPILAMVELITAQRSAESMQHTLSLFSSEMDKTASQELPKIS